MLLLSTPAAVRPAGAQPVRLEVPAASAGTLPLRAAIRLTSLEEACPAGTPPDADECFARTGAALVHGLGSVAESYTFAVDQHAPGCSTGDVLLGADARFTVAGKGRIDLALSGGSGCFTPPEAVLTSRQTFTVTGGSGAYTGASGFGTVEHDVHVGAAGGTGTDTWAGTLSVPGTDFDLTPPALSGAVGKTVRVSHGTRRARVKYRVTARDEVDGIVRVSCRPVSGSLFRIGRTAVTCTATDTSANSAAATFTVTVRAAR